jgi:hypothetical protein
MRSAEARVGASPSEGHHSVAADAAVQATRRGGEPLPEAVRRYFEPRFGQDLGQVRVHTDAEADQASRAIGASAYTVEDHVVFARGRFAPESEEGRHLLAHELTHVVQQRAGGARTAPTVQRQAEEQQAPGATPAYTIAGPQSLQVPQGSGGAPGSVDTDTFVIARTPVTVRISATAAYIGPSTNTSDWSVQLFRSTLWGADEATGPLHRARVGDPLNVSVSVPGGWTASYYLRFRNASQYEPINVTFRVTG